MLTKYFSKSASTHPWKIPDQNFPICEVDRESKSEISQVFSYKNAPFHDHVIDLNPKMSLLRLL